ncbi:MAG: GTPase HflX [Candidatus Marinimicrobia bacterium]|nr:GTPase HflX [Candidatus Neomarinimicrobiota bacterium]
MLEQVLLVGVVTPFQPKFEVDEHLQEVKQLLNTLEYEIAETFIVNLKRIKPSTLIGKGKIREIKNLLSLFDIQEVIFDDDLSPTQVRNLRKMLGIEICDRSGIILEIFANHAQTREAKTQVELATLQYLLPRLTGRWTHLERQIGGISVRGGAGETQIEIDRRLTRTRISKLKKELMKIDKERAVQQKGRDTFFKAALVGYTNAGKSTLMNVFTGSSVPVEDKLFATLDTTVRIYRLDKYHDLLLSDTIGFIRKLPHHLIASFRSTLREVKDADLIIKVADISSSQCLNQLKAVDEVLVQLEAYNKPSIIVFNKIDIMENRILKQVKRDYPDAVFISALNKLRIDELRRAILKVLEKEEIQLKLNVPINYVKGLAVLRDNTRIISENYSDGKVDIEFSVYRKVWPWLKTRLDQNVEFELVDKS